MPNASSRSPSTPTCSASTKWAASTRCCQGSSTAHSLIIVGSSSKTPRGRVIAAANDAPEPFADRMGNLYFTAVAAEEQGRGHGDLLIEHVERELRSRGDAVARVLIFETSSTGQHVWTRTFYRNHGFGEVARIRQFYGPADDKVVFWKSLAESAQRVTASHVCTEDRLSVRRSSCQGFGQCPTTSTDVAGTATVPLMDDGFRTRLHRLR